MRYINKTTAFKLHNTCVTMGKFDGMHKGHQSLFRELLKGRKAGLTSVVFTFDYHPYRLFLDRGIPLLYTEEEKLHILENYEPDVFLSYPFTEETSAMQPEAFIQQVIVDKLGTRRLVVGEDFRFGKDRRGDIAMLYEAAEKHGFQLIVMRKVMLGDAIISSTLIREQLSYGKMEYVNELLGNPYFIYGEVEHGRQLGRTIGMPTINITPHKEKLLPPDGVYFSVTRVGNRAYNGVTNIGIKPTVAKDLKRNVETYLFCFNEEIYGKRVWTQLHSFERHERKFDSLDELKKQIKFDVASAQEFFGLELMGRC